MRASETTLMPEKCSTGTLKKLKDQTIMGKVRMKKNLSKDQVSWL